MTTALTDSRIAPSRSAVGIGFGPWLAGFEPVALEERERIAIALLRECEPADGYYVAFSGGKDSEVIKHLCKLAGVRFDAHYNQTTIDPPELVRHLKQYHPDVAWNLKPSMMHAVATLPKIPPTRMVRWCCEKYKEGDGKDRVRVFGVRRAESPRRKLRWSEVDQYDGKLVICPIVHWSDDDVWAFIRKHALPYCALYDEGIKRIGCVGCMLAGPEQQTREFARWPKFEANWKRAIIANWEKWKDVPNEKGQPRYQSKFKTGEEFWLWWRTKRVPDYFREDHQCGLLWTNQDGDEDDSSANASHQP